MFSPFLCDGCKRCNVGLDDLQIRIKFTCYGFNLFPETKIMRVAMRG
jgi:hypothetical protein